MGEIPVYGEGWGRKCKKRKEEEKIILPKDYPLWFFGSSSFNHFIGKKKKFENCNLHDNYYISSHKQTCATNLGENPTIELILLLSSHDREVKLNEFWLAKTT